MQKALRNIEALKLDVEELGAKLAESDRQRDDLAKQNADLKQSIADEKALRRNVEAELQGTISKLQGENRALTQKIAALPSA